ncbi:hypothetical protein [Phaffia rhodozyma]|uniref:Cohesin loading factor n=1 Tax=Phaffia rhodozyma TaxID=264483 RepID=A0A0F7SRV7_PHARH|nr:hypothetical protein [Phaffia rhodozyma]
MPRSTVGTTKKRRTLSHGKGATSTSYQQTSEEGEGEDSSDEMLDLIDMSTEDGQDSSTVDDEASEATPQPPSSPHLPTPIPVPVLESRRAQSIKRAAALRIRTSDQTPLSSSPIVSRELNPHSSSLRRTSSSMSSPRPHPPLPIPLVSYLCSQLLSPSKSSHPGRSTTPLPNLYMALSLLRSSLSAPGASSGPREEIEMRLLEGSVGVEIVKLSLGMGVRKHLDTQDNVWRERGRIEAKEVERGLGKAISLCQRHPSLASQHLWRLVILQTDVNALLGNHRIAIKALKKALDSPTLSLAARFQLLLSLTNHYITASPPSLSLALSTLSTLHSLATTNDEPILALLSSIAKLGILAREGSWREARRVIDSVRAHPEVQPFLSDSTDPSKTPADTARPIEGVKAKALEKQLLIHFLGFAALVYNHLGEAQEANAMIKVLHVTLDEGNEGTEGLGGGVWEIPLQPTAFGPYSDGSISVPLQVLLTPPHILYVLACLITSLSKRDPAVKRPKKRVFAEEGIRQLDQGIEAAPGISYPPFATVLHVKEWEVKQATMHAELQCEIISVAIIRSEFEEAQESIDSLIAYLRRKSLFPSFSAQVTLLQAHLSHSTLQTDRALILYRVAHHTALQMCTTSASARDLALAAKLGEMGLMVGLGRLDEVRTECEKIAKKSWGNGLGETGAYVVPAGSATVGQGGEPRSEASSKGGKMRDVTGAENVVLKVSGGMLLALMEKEILKSKQHLRSCLELATTAIDNTARPIILSLTAALYLNTRAQQSLVMLQTALHLSRLLGKDGSHGHAALGLWLGEKYESVLKRNKDPNAAGVAKLNQRHREKLAELSASLPHPSPIQPKTEHQMME